jgi:hypothetical protein
VLSVAREFLSVSVGYALLRSIRKHMCSTDERRSTARSWYMHTEHAPYAPAMPMPMLRTFQYFRYGQVGMKEPGIVRIAMNLPVAILISSICCHHAIQSVCRLFLCGPLWIILAGRLFSSWICGLYLLAGCFHLGSVEYPWILWLLPSGLLLLLPVAASTRYYF